MGTEEDLRVTLEELFFPAKGLGRMGSVTIGDFAGWDRIFQMRRRISTFCLAVYLFLFLDSDMTGSFVVGSVA